MRKNIPDDQPKFHSEKTLKYLVKVSNVYGYSPEVKQREYGNFTARITKKGFFIKNTKSGKTVFLTKKQAQDISIVIQDCFYTWNQKY